MAVALWWQGFRAAPLQIALVTLAGWLVYMAMTLALATVLFLVTPLLWLGPAAVRVRARPAEQGPLPCRRRPLDVPDNFPHVGVTRDTVPPAGRARPEDAIECERTVLDAGRAVRYG